MALKNTNITRIMVYSHDTFGLGNLRRMLAICEQLLNCWPNLSVLLVSGSPMIHEFRLPQRLDYIKLPCLNRGLSGELCAKYLRMPTEEAVALRSQLIHSAATHFKPDILLVDKKPTGLKGELIATLDYLKKDLPNSKCVLLLRDILDTPRKTIAEWCKWGYYSTIQKHYAQILVVGSQTVFDIVQEYRLPLPVAHKVCYCGYIRKQPDNRQRADFRAQLNIERDAPLVLVMPGGGEDGYDMVHAYLEGIQKAKTSARDGDLSQSLKSLVLCGPEMPITQQLQLQKMAASCPDIIFKSFSNDLLSCIKAADVVVAMGGYNTLTEILSLGKRVVVVPRIRPSQEQLIRATRFQRKGWVTMLHPEEMTARSLLQTVLKQFSIPPSYPNDIDFNGLSCISHHLLALVSSDLSGMNLSPSLSSPSLCLPA